MTTDRVFVPAYSHLYTQKNRTLCFFGLSLQGAVEVVTSATVRQACWTPVLP